MMTREESMTLMSIDPRAMSAAGLARPFAGLPPEEHDSNRRIRRVV